MLYNIVLASAIYQHELASGVRSRLNLHLISHHPIPSLSIAQSTGLSSLCHKFLLAIYLTNGHVYVSCYSLNSCHPLLPPLCPHVCSLCCIAIAALQVHQYHLSIFHMHVLIYSICLSLSGLLHSVL